jgi:hypothetical protein
MEQMEQIEQMEDFKKISPLFRHLKEMEEIADIRKISPLFRPMMLDNTNDCVQMIDALKKSVKYPDIEKQYPVMNTRFFPKINCFVPLLRLNNDTFMPSKIQLNMNKMTYNIGDKYSIKYNSLEKTVVMN